MADEHHVKRDQLYEQVGKALTWWSYVEESLCSLYVLATLRNPDDPSGPASNAYWAVIAFQGKLKMANAAIQFRAAKNECLLNEWNTIFNALGNKSDKRNELAHGTVVTLKYEDEKTNEPVTKTFFAPSLYKSFYKSMEEHLRHDTDFKFHPDTWPKVRLSRADIKERRKSFRRINTRLTQFRERFVEYIEMSAEDPEPSDEADQESRNEDTPTQ